MGEKQPSRRQVLIQTVGLMITTPLALAISRCDKSTSTMATREGAFAIANQPSGIYVFDLAYYPGLATPGGFIQIGVNATSGYKSISIVRADSSTLFTVLRICPYSNCTLSTYAAGYSCYCDGSVFNADGSVRIGPSTLPLTTYTTTLVGNTVVVNIA